MAQSVSSLQRSVGYYLDGAVHVPFLSAHVKVSPTVVASLLNDHRQPPEVLYVQYRTDSVLQSPGLEEERRVARYIPTFLCNVIIYKRLHKRLLRTNH